MKRKISLLLATLSLFAFHTFARQGKEFSDVSAQNWAYKAITHCAQEGLMVGTGEDSFSPNSSLTWGEAVVLAARMYEDTHEDVRIPQLIDVPWWQGAVNVLTDAGILLPDNLTATANRQGFIYLLHEVLPEDTLEPLPYEEGAMRPYFGERYNSHTPQYVKDFYDAGILSGVPIGDRVYGEFCPQNALTREQAAGILYLINRPGERGHPDYDFPYVSPTGVSLAGALARQTSFVDDSLFDLNGYAEEYVYLIVDGQPLLARDYLTCGLTSTWENPYDGSMPWDKAENPDEVLTECEALYHFTMLRQFFLDQGVAEEDLADRIASAQIEETDLFQRFDLNTWAKAIQRNRGWDI